MVFYVKVGQTKSVRVAWLDAQGQPASLKPASVSWHTLDNAVATVVEDPGNPFAAVISGVSHAGSSSTYVLASGLNFVNDVQSATEQVIVPYSISTKFYRVVSLLPLNLIPIEGTLVLDNDQQDLSEVALTALGVTQLGEAGQFDYDPATDVQFSNGNVVQTGVLSGSAFEIDGAHAGACVITIAGTNEIGQPLTATLNVLVKAAVSGTITE